MRIPVLLSLALLVFLAAACTDDRPPRPAPTEEALSAATIIQTAIDRNGLAGFDSTAVSFRFRDKRYRYQRLNGRYAYERWWQDTTSGERVRDVLTNEGLTRYIDGQAVELEEKKRKAYANSVNSVVYFAFMPWALADPSVVAEYTGVDTVRGHPLLHLTVGFASEDPEQHTDDYEYWFDPESYDIRYLAYSEPGHKAPRFREAYGNRSVAGFRVRDYRNYTTADKSPRYVDELAALFTADSLRLLSVIEHDDYRREAIEDRDRPMPAAWWARYGE